MTVNFKVDVLLWFFGQIRCTYQATTNSMILSLITFYIHLSKSLYLILCLKTFLLYVQSP